jgi:hypothetical protein
MYDRTFAHFYEQNEKISCLRTVFSVLEHPFPILECPFPVFKHPFQF